VDPLEGCDPDPADVSEPDAEASSFGRPSPASSVDPPLRSASEPSEGSYRAEGGTVGWLALRAATVTGVRHRLSGSGNEDCYAWASVPGQVAVAVTDGVGTVPGSAAAARLVAVTAAASALAGGPDADGPAGRAVVSAQSRLEQVFACDGSTGATGATTLVVAVVQRDGAVELARVGDSTAFLIRSGDSGWEEVFEAPAGGTDQVAVETSALSGNPVHRRDASAGPEIEVVRVSLRDGDVLAVVTDGIAGPWRDGPLTVAQAMVDRLGARPTPLDLAALADFSRQGCHDDRTVVALWRCGH